MEEEGRVAVAAHERDGLVGEDVGEVAAVAGLHGTIAVHEPVPVVGPPAAEACELGEAAPVGVVAIVEGAVVPLADEAGGVTGGGEQIGDGAVAELDAVEPASLQRVDGAGAMWVAPGEERCSGRRTHG